MLRYNSILGKVKGKFREISPNYTFKFFWREQNPHNPFFNFKDKKRNTFNLKMADCYIGLTLLHSFLTSR